MNRHDNDNTFAVSAVIPAYNAESFIGRAIDSVLAQTRRCDEIIVVDDGSTDGTAEAIRSYGSQVHYIWQENGGASVARNTGVEAAENEWIAFLDADDEWLPEKLQIQIEHLKRNGDLVWTYSDYFIHSAGEKERRQAFAATKYTLAKGEKEYFEDYLGVYPAVCIRTSTAVVRKSVLCRTGLFRVGQWWSQDTDLFLRIAYVHPQIGFVSEPLAVYHANIPGCITLRNKNRIPQRCDFMERHLAIAAGHDRLADFEPCAQKVLTNWMRSIITDDRYADVGEMLERFDGLLPAALKSEMRLRMRFPHVAPRLLQAYFATKNALRSAGIIRGADR